MGDVSSSVTIKDMVPSLGVKALLITAPNTVDDGDTIAITLSTYGITTFLGVIGFIHTTENSVVVQEEPTTAVSTGTLTITVGGSTDNKKRVYIIYGI